MLYRIEDGGAALQPVASTTTTDESLREVDLEDWIERSPELLDEELLVVGRQVEVDDGKDRIDLLALDLEANLVVIELKRDLVGGDADLQAVRYAAMVAGWTEETVRGLAEEYWKSSKQDRGAFTKELDEFCDAGYEVNARQRILLVGRHVHPRVATMALWLREAGVDIRVLGMDFYRDGDRLYVAPHVVIPLPTEHDVAARPEPSNADKEWRRDGPAWHLEQQLAEDGREILDRLMTVIEDAVPQAEGPRWQQKNYITWRYGGRNWIRAYTDNPHQLALMVYGMEGRSVEDVAVQLGLPTQVAAESLDVSRVNPGGSASHVWIVLKELDDLLDIEPALRQLLEESWGRFTGVA